MPRIQGEPIILNHGEAVKYFCDLLRDLKLREAGLEHEPITMERLKIGSKHLFEIQACQRPAKIRR